MKHWVAAASLSVLAACGSEELARFEASPERPLERVRIAYNTVSVREVTLPTYAAGEEIARAEAEGQVVANPSSLWADDPVRAITLDIARALKDISGRRVAPDPWPYQSRAEVTVDVRFEELLPTAAGTYRAAGLYFVAPEDEGRREHAHDFDFSVVYDPGGGFAALAAARSRLMNTLALEIAKTALR